MTTSKAVLRACPVCGHDRGEVVHTQHFSVPDELRVHELFDVVACLACGFVFADTVMEQEALDEVYEEHSKYADTSIYDEGSGDVTRDAPWDIDRLRQTAAFLAERVPDRSARVLDAGCSTGTLLGFLKEHGFTNLVGLDPSPAVIAFARREHGVEGYAASFLAPPPDVGQFDVVALSHTLEHLADVGGAVAALHRVLRPGGLAYIEVPDARHYAGHLVTPFNDFNTEHINHFSLPTLERALATAGFERVIADEKLILCAPRFTYPALYGLWRRAEAPVAVPANRDDALVAGIGRYVEDSNRLLAAVDADLRRRIDGEVIVWGAGQLAMKLLRDTVLAETPIAAIVDGSADKQGLHLSGHLVQSPADVKDLDHPIVVTSVHREDFIVHDIREQGMQNKLVLLYRPPDAAAA